MSRSFIILVCVVTSACGGAVVDLDGGDLDSGGQDSANKQDGGGGDATPVSFACGKTFCSGDNVCVHPCCGGAMICAGLEDGGVCPPGLSLSQQCPSDMPCTNVCTPPEPYCEPASQCPMAQGHDCFLLCE